jgi:hypothetical protein
MSRKGSDPCGGGEWRVEGARRESQLVEEKYERGNENKKGYVNLNGR